MPQKHKVSASNQPECQLYDEKSPCEYEGDVEDCQEDQELVEELHLSKGMIRGISQFWSRVQYSTYEELHQITSAKKRREECIGNIGKI